MSTRTALLALVGILVVVLGGRFVSNQFCTDDTAGARHTAMAAVETAAKEVFLDKKFSVSPGENLSVKVGHVDVTIQSGPSREARVQVLIEGSRSREYAEHLKFEVEKVGRSVSVTTNPPRRNWNWNWGSTDVDVVITVPDVFDAHVAVAHGDVEVERLKGEISFNTAHGDLEIGSLSGSSTSITTAHGDLDAREIASAKVRVTAAHGDVSIEKITSDEFEMTSSHGDISVERAEGRASVSNSHGDIEINFAQSVSGDFSNSHGDIDLSASSAAGADVEFEAESIDLARGYEFVGTQKRDRVEGKINGGGPRLSARTTHGSISLRTN